MNGDVSGALPDPTEAAVTPPRGTDSERLLAALQSGQDPFEVLDPTAAVVSGGPGDDGGGGFVRLARILETTSPLDLAYPNPNRGLDTLNLLWRRRRGAGAGGAGNTNNAPIKSTTRPAATKRPPSAATCWPTTATPMAIR